VRVSLSAPDMSWFLQTVIGGVASFFSGTSENEEKEEKKKKKSAFVQTRLILNKCRLL
jgi:hypothetical protein